ncbi:MAG: hypothetical protein ACD_3C00223G0002 [uncultured bacterium (gcode 4)]|uniref:PrgI family protein n=1 Tax=uncultured bacterium (gcode 4) TaxID=1234023 RepID=K2GVH4_9BACT|nr:MAG: hypothetical protein ACD_3C00223G0002 [uncultured bacterium (gcode 4)]
MQYKIPVQIENEDKIFLNLSLRQIMILMIGFSVAYTVFKSLEKNVWWTVALFPTIIIGFITFVIAVFKHTEMTFVPFLLNLIRLQLNSWLRVWSKWVESFSKVEVWYVPPEDSIQEKMHSKTTKHIHDDILSKI